MEYISSADQKSLNTRYRTAVVLALAFASSAIVLLIAARIITIPQQLVETVNWQKILYTGAIIIGLAAVVLRRLFLSRPMMMGAVRRGAEAVLQRLTIASVIGGALGEMAAIFGFLGYLLTGDLDYSWRLGVVGLLIIAYSFPRRGEWARQVALVEKESPEAKLLGNSGV
jgi:MFS family permease